MKRIVSTTKAPGAQGPYSQAVVVENLIFAAGQIALTTDGKIVNQSVKEETDQIMANLTAILQEAGASLEDVVKSVVYCTDVSLFTEFNEIYASYFKDNHPAREFIGIKDLPLGVRLEISMIAVMPKK